MITSGLTYYSGKHTIPSQVLGVGAWTVVACFQAQHHTKKTSEQQQQQQQQPTPCEACGWLHVYRVRRQCPGELRGESFREQAGRVRGRTRDGTDRVPLDRSSRFAGPTPRRRKNTLPFTRRRPVNSRFAPPSLGPGLFRLITNAQLPL